MSRFYAAVIVVAGALVSLAGAPSRAEAQTPEIRLWPGKAPGSETWSIPEVTTRQASGDRTVTNVSDPTLTVFLPDPSRAVGTAVIIAPGGAWRALSFDNEGVKVAQWLNERGVAAFVLKYRTLQVQPPPTLSGGGAPAGRGRGLAPIPGMPGPGRQEMVIRNANANPAPDDAALTEVLRLGVADAEQAVRLVRQRASEWRVDPSRVGLMGFSAGGGVIIGAALAPKSGASPDFLVSVYGPSLMDVVVPDHAPPLFIAVGATHFNVTNGCLALFAAWKAAGKPAELHVYDGVSGGFGMTPRGLPVDGWIERLWEWMAVAKVRK